MKVIYKYILDPKNPIIKIPISGEILSVGSQNNNICLWVKVDTENKEENRFFDIYGTGQKLPKYSGHMHNYIGTVFIHNMLVFHIYENTT